ncbi:MAG TPA: phosphotransferase [Microcella sp.]|nr:phosphotransferase [Microcella sp.]
MGERLEGGNMNAVEREGDTVLRNAGPWTPTVHALLTHLRAAGIDGVPQPLGIDTSANPPREQLTYIDGHVPLHPLPEWVWHDNVLSDGASWLRRMHNASATFPRDGQTWQQPVREPAEVICHNDFAPHNLGFDADHRLIGVIDWDMCSPGPRIRDLAYFATRAVPLTAEPPAGAPSGDQVRPRIQRIIDAYGSDASADEVLKQAVAGLRELAAYSRKAADRLHKPELREHAALYDRDAAAIESGDIGSSERRSATDAQR